MTVGCANFFLLVGAVNVNVARVGVAAQTVVFPILQPVKPEDARGDEVFPLHFLWGVGEGKSQRLATLEDHAGRGVFTDAFADLMETVRRAKRVGNAGRCGTGSGDGISRKWLSAAEVPEFLLAYRDAKTILPRRQMELFASGFAL